MQVQAVENQPDFIQLQENTVVQKGETFVKKEFPGHGCFLGVVTDIYVGKDGKLLYDILYEDNDSEHLDIFELAPIIVKNAGTTSQQSEQIIVQPPLNTRAESVSSPHTDPSNSHPDRTTSNTVNRLDLDSSEHSINSFSSPSTVGNCNVSQQYKTPQQIKKAKRNFADFLLEHPIVPLKGATQCYYGQSCLQDLNKRNISDKYGLGSGKGKRKPRSHYYCGTCGNERDGPFLCYLCHIAYHGQNGILIVDTKSKVIPSAKK